MSDFDKNECTCIGCGCTDGEACHHQGEFCHWLRVDRDLGLGVCSHCQLSVAFWDALRDGGHRLIVENDEEPQCPRCHTPVQNWQGNQTLLNGKGVRTMVRCTKCRKLFRVWASVHYRFGSDVVGSDNRVAS